MKAYSLDLRKKIVEAVKKGVSKSQTTQRFGVVDRATLKRYCKRLDECGTLAPSKRSGKRPKLDQRAMKLLEKDLKEKPWATHSQRREFLFAICGVRVNEATGFAEHSSASHSQKRIQSSRKKKLVLEAHLAHPDG
jgi:transposase